jgi:hypothetical protein
MKTLCASGLKVTKLDIKALEEYLNTSPKEWATNALKGMINKAIKTIMKDYLEAYKAQAGESIPADLPSILSGILAMSEFVPYNRRALEDRNPERTETCDQEIWNGGFQIEDHEDQALRAYYIDPEITLVELMENKIALRKAAFTKEYTQQLIEDPAVTTIPTTQDGIIDLIVKKPEYKNRVARDAEFNP